MFSEGREALTTAGLETGATPSATREKCMLTQVEQFSVFSSGLLDFGGQDRGSTRL